MIAIVCAKASYDYKTFEYIVIPEILAQDNVQAMELVCIYETATNYHGFKEELLPQITLNLINSETNELYQTVVLSDTFDIGS